MCVSVNEFVPLRSVPKEAEEGALEFLGDYEPPDVSAGT